MLLKYLPVCIVGCLIAHSVITINANEHDTTEEEEILDIRTPTTPHNTNTKKRTVPTANIKKIANTHIKHNNTPHNTPCIEKVCTSVQAMMHKHAIKSIDEAVLNKIISLTQSLDERKSNTTLMPYDDLVGAVGLAVIEYFQKNCGDTVRVPSSMRPELLARKDHCIGTLQKLFEQHGSCHINSSVIARYIEDIYDGFIQRMEHVLLWEWLELELENIKKEPRGSTPNSAIKPNKQSKKFKERYNIKL